jgi:hypothetical protein
MLSRSSIQISQLGVSKLAFAGITEEIGAPEA